ncbi:type II secretion system protein [Methylophaga thiooxydans]|uniref:Prepilin-type N-terminal cleavage/methylation domain protein n=1 Tax=Methylophaga thiooxydans DMS010 TaxID=637616 RepID=C0N7U6_9GAMM|nr:type II secretion system protein [Methylophaga thiooxydans]EEF79564.1 prepilin-type N-terminal cleavage/methylation domain protein [Methylophaga thiooxydans DMS010]
MNIQEMKATISKFRRADLSVIKDEKLRAKGQKLQGKEKGFTLLELLVVITLIAILATGALIAYEDVGASAEAASAGNTAATIDRAIRTYRAVENVYPNQWDNLLDADGDRLTFDSSAMTTYLAAWNPSTVTSAGSAIIDMMEESGIEELQVVNAGGEPTGDQAPNRFHNESSGDAAEVEIEDGDLPTAFAVVPNDNCQGTNAAAAIGTYPNAAFDTTVQVSGNNLQNQYGDALEGDECHVLIALGFGGDAAASTTFSNVAIAQSPTYVRNTGDEDTEVNPEIHYSRYIGLFQAGEYNLDDDAMEWNDTLRLIAIVSTDGKNIDQLVSEAQQ